METYPERLASHVLFFAIFFLVIVNVGFFIGIPITHFILPLAYILYLTILFLITRRSERKVERLHIISAMVIVLIFGIGIFIFGHTYDFSYDGQSFDETALISLANGWNPIRDSQVVIPAPTGLYGIGGEFGRPDVIGYPKMLWEIQASIYKLTGRINSGMITNLVAALAAFIFLYYLLQRLGLRRFWAAFTTSLAVLGPVFIQQLFSYMSDGFGYELSLIAIVSLITLALEKGKTRPLLVFMFSWLFLVGTKYSNGCVAFVLAFVCLIILIQIVRDSPKLFKPIFKILLGGALVGVIILIEPYVINLIRYGSPLYPDNATSAIANVETENIPHNLVSDNKFELIFYGIYSQRQPSSNSTAAENVALLKIPFSTSLSELQNSAVAGPSDRVGSGGIFFSGVFTLSLIILVCALLFEFSSYGELVLGLTSLIVFLILACALPLPAPNVLRFTPLITVIPVFILISLLLIDKSKPPSWVRVAIRILALSIIINIGMYIVLVGDTRSNVTREINQQLISMRDSGLTYNVYAAGFYSSYIRLEEAGIKFHMSSNIGCTNPQTLDLTYAAYATTFCPQKK